MNENPIVTFDEEKSVRLAAYLKALSEPKRLRLFQLLMQGIQCNCDLGSVMGLAPNLISHHLGMLRSAGLVDVDRDAVDARWIYYSPNVAALREMHVLLGDYFDPSSVKPRRMANCRRAAHTNIVSSLTTISLEEGLHD